MVRERRRVTLLLQRQQRQLAVSVGPDGAVSAERFPLGPAAAHPGGGAGGERVEIPVGADATLQGALEGLVDAECAGEKR